MRCQEHANCSGDSVPPPPHHPVESSPNPNRSGSATKSFASTPSCHRRAVGRLPITSMRRKTGSVQCPPYSTTEQRKGWSLMTFFAHATRGLRRMQGSRQTVLLARRAPTIKRWSRDARGEEQSAYSLWRTWKIRRCSLNAHSGRSVSPIPEETASLEGRLSPR